MNSSYKISATVTKHAKGCQLKVVSAVTFNTYTHTLNGPSSVTTQVS